MIKILKNDFLIVIIVSAVIVLPFINQAYYIDDFIYLSAAIQYNESGFDSFRGMSDQEGFVVPNYYLTHPLLWPWFLSLFIKIFNTTNEAVLHLLPLVHLIITGISSLIIAKRFSNKPLTATILFLILPAVMLLSHVLMTDLPTAAYFLLAIALHIEGLNKSKNILFLCAGITASISCGISYQALMIIPIILFYNILNKEKKFSAYLTIVIPFITFAAWFIYTWIEFGIPHPLVSFQWGDVVLRSLTAGFLPKLIANINVLGATTIFPAVILLVYSLNQTFRKLAIVSLIISLPSVFIFASRYSIVQKVLFVIYFSAGLLIILRFIKFFFDSIRTKEKQNIFLSVWFLAFYFAIVLLMPIGVARYLLPSFLPLIILFIKDAEKIFKHEKLKPALTFSIIITAVWGLLCSISDYHLADIYRNITKEIKSTYSDRNIWFSSDSFQWYMKQEGYKPVLYNDNSPAIGDIIVMSTELWPYYVPDVMERAKEINRIEFNSAYPIRTMNQASNAGFHDHLQGVLPFTITKSKFEIIYIYEIVK